MPTIRRVVVLAGYSFVAPSTAAGAVTSAVPIPSQPGSSAAPKERVVILLPALGIAFLVLLLVVVPTLVITRDLARGRPDIAYLRSEE
jgi:hypothetical protein